MGRTSKARDPIPEQFASVDAAAEARKRGLWSETLVNLWLSERLSAAKT